jgi:hypothetical protein
LTKSQRLGKEKNLHKKIIKNSPKIENGLRTTIEIGNHALNKKKIFKNGIVNSEPGNTSPHNINHLNKKIIIKKDNNQNIDEIKTNDNKLNIRKNNKKNTINGSELHQKPKIEKLNSENINLRGSKRIINRSKDFNNIKYEINNSLKIVEPKEIVDQEIRKINIKKISIINGRHIHSIKCFNSNSSQALFNTNINNSAIIDKNIPKFKKMIDFKENENENSIINKTKIINDNTYQNNLYNSKSEVNINSYFKKGFSNEINNNFYSKINLKKRNNPLLKDENIDQSDNIASGLNNNTNKDKDNDNINNKINNSNLEMNSLKKEEEQENLDSVLSSDASFENEENNSNKEANNENKIENEKENENKSNNIITEKNNDENGEGIRRIKRSRRLTLPPVKTLQNIVLKNNINDNNLKEKNNENILNFKENIEKKEENIEKENE